MSGQDAADRARDARAGGEQPTMAVWTVTVTSPTGRVDTVEVPASSARAAFPTACAWYPRLPLTGAHVEVVEVRPASAQGPDEAAADAAGDARGDGAVSVAAPPSRLRGAA
jgi:hypothetical protein